MKTFVPLLFVVPIAVIATSAEVAAAPDKPSVPQATVQPLSVMRCKSCFNKFWQGWARRFESSPSLGLQSAASPSQQQPVQEDLPWWLQW